MSCSDGYPKDTINLAKHYDQEFQIKIKEFEGSCNSYFPYIKCLVDSWVEMIKMQRVINEMELKWDANIKDIISEGDGNE